MITVASIVKKKSSLQLDDPTANTILYDMNVTQ